MITAEFVADPGLHIVLETFELTRRQRISRENPQGLGAIKVLASIAEVMGEFRTWSEIRRAVHRRPQTIGVGIVQLPHVSRLMAAHLRGRKRWFWTSG